LRLTVSTCPLEHLLFSRGTNHDNCGRIGLIDLGRVRTTQQLDRERSPRISLLSGPCFEFHPGLLGPEASLSGLYPAWLAHGMACRRGGGPVFKTALAGEFEGMTACRPWWQTTKTARQGFVMGTFWTALGLVGLLGAAHTPVFFVVSAVWLAVGVGYVGTAVALRRRERSSSGPDP